MAHTEITRFPRNAKHETLDSLERLGTVSNSRTNPELRPFESVEPFTVDAQLFESYCTECDDVLVDGECEACTEYEKHDECRETGQLCEDCLGTAIDKAHDYADQER